MKNNIFFVLTFFSLINCMERSPEGGPNSKFEVSRSNAAPATGFSSLNIFFNIMTACSPTSSPAGSVDDSDIQRAIDKKIYDFRLRFLSKNRKLKID